MMKDPQAASLMRPSSLKREGFFLQFAARVVRKKLAGNVPLMLTGGFRTRRGIERALNTVDIVGIARPLCVDPSFPRRFIAGDVDDVPPYKVEVKGPLAAVLSPSLNSFWHQRQMTLLAAGREPDFAAGFAYPLTWMFFRTYISDPKSNPSLWNLSALLLLALLALLALNPPECLVHAKEGALALLKVTGFV